ncbi:hypothetical protein B4102_0338 [Heyndrickxia sporothermodurans]|uniref:Uncharacterized protein n=1 Tax=Heyndrickxia sporothermodurans TaxID=46224 RepID=A0A150LD25_9BACI|nr:hypothetical protein B4102_0338 [Heyndrickxia sporothermodurans]
MIYLLVGIQLLLMLLIVAELISTKKELQEIKTILQKKK